MISLRVVIFACVLLARLSFSQTQNCYIINNAAVKVSVFSFNLDVKLQGKPYPSLIQCYKNNPSSCCNSLADEYIKTQYDALLSTSCQRSYPWLETYFCLACSPSEPTVTNHTAKEVRLCRSFMENIWSSSLDQSSTVFDSCGMTTIWETNQTVILPSQTFSSAVDFITTLKPPFFEDYSIVIVDDDDADGCYSSANWFRINMALLSVLILFLFVF